MRINDLIVQAHTNAVDHGWWDNPKTMGELLALIHSEVSEALEEHRNGKGPNETYYSCKSKSCGTDFIHLGGEEIFTSAVQGVNFTDAVNEVIQANKPEGIPSELADIVIRVADLCGYYGIDLEAAITEKMEYNKSRPYKHGNKVI